MLLIRPLFTNINGQNYEWIPQKSENFIVLIKIPNKEIEIVVEKIWICQNS